jgi:hypothetical protein
MKIHHCHRKSCCAPAIIRKSNAMESCSALFIATCGTESKCVTRLASLKQSLRKIYNDTKTERNPKGFATYLN